MLGRALRPEDDVRGAAPVMVLSHRAWRRQFGGASTVLGRRVVLHEDGVAYTVVGVMPAGVDFPRGSDAWMPMLAATPERNLEYLGLDVLGRLAPGASAANARNELSTFLARADHPAQMRELRGVVHSLPRMLLGESRPAVFMFAAAAGLLLLITCVNVANLLLVRGLGRAREVAVRTALGASRRQLVGQLLIEHALLALAGGVLGLMFAWAALRTFVEFAPAGLPRLDEIRFDVTALASAVVITAIAVLIFGLVPAVTSSRVELGSLLSSGNRRSASRRARLLSELLVAAQVGLAVLVLSAAALIGRSLLALEHAKLNFDESHLLVAELALRGDTYDSAPKQIAMLERLLPAIGTIPGVVSATPVVATPYAPVAWAGNPAIEGQSANDAANNPMLAMEVVSPSYFTAFGIRLLRGRPFTNDDRPGAPNVVVLSETAARQYWPNADPIGKRLLMPSEPPFTVVGVVPDTRYRDLREATPTIYFPLAQSFFPFAPTTLAIRTTSASSAVVPALRRVLEETAPGVTFASIAPFGTFLEGPLAQPRLNALLLSVFAGAAVSLAGIGLFAVMATTVGQRTREFGVRMALGATASNIARLVVGRGVTIAAVGAAAGVLAALSTNHLLRVLLYRVSPTDARTLATVVLSLLAVAVVASFVPARIGAKTDPGVSLRAE